MGLDLTGEHWEIRLVLHNLQGRGNETRCLYDGTPRLHFEHPLFREIAVRLNIANLFQQCQVEPLENVGLF